MRSPFALSLALVATSGLAGQEGHEQHAEHVGRVRFPVSCNTEAQRSFERGVALLHSFWYEKAGDAFKDAVAADSTCAMTYWGQAMAILHPLWTAPAPAELGAGLAAADRGLALARTPRERDYLGAIRSYYAEYATLDAKARLAIYSQSMDGVRRRNPRDREARIFYALSLIALGQANATDTTFAFQKRADSILEPLFKAEPDHPGLAHYLIHTNDVPQLARLGLYAARRYAQIAPDVPHAQHMPSHIFTRLGRWDEATHLVVRPAPEWRAAEAVTHFARAIGAARGGDTALARADVATLGEIEQALGAAGGQQAYWAGQVKIQRLAAGAWLARATGDPTEAVRQATAAADIEDVTQKDPVTPGALLPARELLGDLLLELNRPADAARAYEASLRQAPGRARSLFGLARAAEQAGDITTARARYRDFLELMAKADGDRPELAVARRAIASR